MPKKKPARPGARGIGRNGGKTGGVGRLRGGRGGEAVAGEPAVMLVVAGGLGEIWEKMT